MNRTVQIALGAVIIVIGCAASFYGGMMYGKGQSQNIASAAATGAPAAQGQNGQRANGTGGPGGGMLSGQVQTVANGVLTIVDSSGKLTDITVTDTTLIQKQASVPLTDLQKGESVLVSGNQASDGSVTARSVQVMSGDALGPMPTGNPPAGAPSNGQPPAGFRP